MDASDILDTTLQHLERLIAFPSVSVDSNIALIAYTEEVLQTLGARTTLTYDETHQKANLFATVGPEIDGGVVLSGHTDVVPVAGQAWESDPFVARGADGRIYGRGACDMKGFIACALAMAPHFAAAKLTKPVHFGFTYDEETGCFGAPVLLAELMRTGPKPAVAIIGEPTLMTIIEAHKGCYEYTTAIGGLEGHASQPDNGANAVEYGARFVNKLMALGADVRRWAPPDSPFEPPHTTVSVGCFHGGIARNVIPHECAVEWEMRPVQQADARYILDNLENYTCEQLLPAMQTVYPQASITTHTIAEVDGLEPVTDSQALALVRELTGGNTTGVVSFATEAGLFQRDGIAAVVCGPGSIEQAHMANEYIAISQLDACLHMLHKLARKLAG